MLELERRHADLAWPGQDIELRAVGDGMEFRGYAAVFNSQSEDLGGFRETIMPGAFTRSLNAAANGSADIRMFWNHDQGRPLASTKARTLRLSQDERGLVAEANLANTTYGRDMAELIRTGDVRTMSFGFTVPQKRSDGQGRGADPATRENGYIRTVHEANLLEVSPVTGWPAYRATSVSIRHLLGPVDWSDEENAQAVIGDLSEAERATFMRLLNRNSPTPFIAPDVAGLRARLEARKAA